MLKKSLKIFIGIVIFLVIFIAFLLSDFNPVFQNDEFVFITNEVKKAQKENLNHAVDIYNKIYKTTKENDCPCQIVSNKIPTNSHSSFAKKALYYFKINTEFTHDECLKFVLLQYDFGFDAIGIEEASKFYLKKDFEQLNQKELLILIAMLKNSILYNPIRNKEKLRMRVQVLERILHK